jgi:uncharacterized protein (TIGR02271 family)
MDRTMGADLSQIQQGWDVYGSDGQEIGDVAEVGPNYIVVEKGFLLPKDLYIPVSAIRSVSSDRVELSVPKDAVEDQNWDAAPEATVTDDTTTEYRDRDYATVDTGATERDEGTLERREERLQVDKQQVQTGEVRVGKDVVEEQQSVDVPVSREEVNISTRQVDRPAGGEALAEGETVSVPISEERVEVGKDARVVEELDVDKVARQDTERVSDTVRREEFKIEEEGDVTRR